MEFPDTLALAGIQAFQDIQAQVLAAIPASADTVAIPVEVVIPALVYQVIPAIPEAMEQMALLGLVASLVFQGIQDLMDLQVLLDLADIPALVDILAQDCQVFLGLLAQALQSMQQQA